MRHNQLPDTAEFLRLLHSRNRHPWPAVRHFFAPGRPIFVVRAPGRLDVMGGIADYSGALVLQMPIAQATHVAVQRAGDATLQLISLGDNRDETAAVFSMSLNDFDKMTYETAISYFQKAPHQAWAAYVAGIFLVLMRERRIKFSTGARILIHSNVPEGKGVSSSAALEVAAMSAITTAFGLDVFPRDLALLCQVVENRVVNAPCGVMDQMTAVCGRAGHLLALLCRPAEIQGFITIPDQLRVWGIDSGIRHAVSGASYTNVRAGAFMGYKILQSHAGQDWNGYLTNLSPAEFEQNYRRSLPEQMRGADFLALYGKTADTVTQVHPGEIYPIQQPTAHPIYEHFRVKTFARLLRDEAMAAAPLLGELMYQSHASYSACGLGSDGTDLLVQMARQAGPDQGIYGAKITGGGSGGTVAILGQHDAEKTVLTIARQYAAQTGGTPYIFSGSSPGTAVTGCLEIAP